MAIDNPVAPEIIVEQPVETIEVHPSERRRISWGAVIAGVVVALVTQIVLSILGIAIGISTIEPAGTRTHWPEALTTGAGIWWVITGILALFAGGLVAGRLAGIPRKADGLLHGLITYAVTTLLSVYMLTTAVGGLVSGAWALVQSGATPPVGLSAPMSAGSFVMPGARALDVDRLRRDVLVVVRAHPKEAAGTQASDAAEQEVFIAARRSLELGGGDAVAREVLVTALMNRTVLTRAEAERAVEEWDRAQSAAAGPTVVQGQDPRNQDLNALAQRTKHAVVAAAIWSFIALVIGAIAAALGGVVGSNAKDLRTDRFATVS